MANRVLMGNRATGGYGLYVSKTGDDVLTTTNPMAFDSRTGTGWAVKDYGQFIISAGGADVTKTHNLGYNPLVAIRWSTSITSGVSTLVLILVRPLMKEKESRVVKQILQRQVQDLLGLMLILIL